MRLVLVLAIAACGSGKTTEGLPPAVDWSADDPTTTAPPKDPTAKKVNPHEGVPGAPDISEDDPHRDVPGAPSVVGDDEAEPPDLANIDVTPEQPIDPATRVRGTIKLARAVASRVKPDGIIYLMAKTPDASGKPTGTAMAVERLMWKADGQSFELGGATGDVLVIARYDQDGEGSSSQSGDVIGMTRVKVPADNVVIELSSIVP